MQGWAGVLTRHLQTLHHREMISKCLVLTEKAFLTDGGGVDGGIDGDGGSHVCVCVCVCSWLAVWLSVHLSGCGWLAVWLAV